MAVTFQTTTLATPGSGTIVATDDAGASGHVQILKLAISTAGSASLIPATSANGLTVDVTRLPALAAGTNNIGKVDVNTVPADPFGANADAASTSGSISAKLRSIAATGIPVTAVPADPFGVNADAASASGSISAKLRFIATTGIPITGTVAVTQSGSWSLAANQSVNVAQINGVAPTMGNGISGTGVQRVTIASDSTGQIAVASVPADPFGLNADAASASGSISAKLRFIATTGIPITGTVTVAGTVTASNVTGAAAHAAAISGNPVRIGGRARTSEVTAIANDQVADFVTDVTGKQIVLPYANPENLVDGVASTTATTDTSTIAAQGVGVRTYLTEASFVNSSATATVVEIKDGTTVRWRTMAPAGGGSNITFPSPLKGTANTAWNFAALTGVTTLYGAMGGYKGV